MHSTFYHVPLRDMFVRRVLWNMPKINPEDYKPDPHDQTLPESPPIPPLTPPTSHNQPDQHQVYSKRRKRPRIESKLESPKMESVEPNPKDYAVVRTKLEEMQWVPVPATSPKEKLKELNELFKQDPDMCRFCGDMFCRDPTWGDPYLISCAKCGNKYHSFCVDSKPNTKSNWRCYTCQHAVREKRPGLTTRPDDNPAVLCQFCHRNSPGVAGRLVEYGGLGDTASNFAHENCAFYSKGVTKRDDQWFGLHSAVRESHLTKCSFCHKKGASIPCDFPKCRKLFHYICSKHNECYMVEGDLQHLFCDQHMEIVLKNPDMLNPAKTPSFQIPPPVSPETIVAVPQTNIKKKLATKKAKRKPSSVPDRDGEEDSSPSCQVL